MWGVLFLSHSVFDRGWWCAGGLWWRHASFKPSAIYLRRSSHQVEGCSSPGIARSSLRDDVDRLHQRAGHAQTNTTRLPNGPSSSLALKSKSTATFCRLRFRRQCLRTGLSSLLGFCL